MKTTIKNGLIVTFINEGYHSIKIKQADILIEDGIITDISEELPLEGTIIDADGKWVFPGLVNIGSSTAASTLTRGLLPDYKRHNWQGTLIYSRINPMIEIAGMILEEDEKYELIKYGMLKALSSGSTSVVDMNSPDFAKAAAKAAEDIGMRAWIVSMNTAGSLPTASHEGMLDCPVPSGNISLTQSNSSTNRSIINGLYSIETTSKELWDKINSEKETKPLILYGAYSNYEKQISWTRYGKSPIAHIKENNGLSERTVLLQSLFTDFFDRERIRTAKTSISLCPSDALHDGVQLPIVTFLRQDINTAIGTGYSGASMLEEMKLASYGAKLETNLASQFQASDAFYAATVAGSRAIGDPMVGRIDIGYHADLMIIDPQRFAPSNYPLVSLVYYGESRDIDKVIVGGKTVYDSETDRKQIHELGGRVQKIAEKVWEASRKSM